MAETNDEPQSRAKSDNAETSETKVARGSRKNSRVTQDGAAITNAGGERELNGQGVASAGSIPSSLLDASANELYIFNPDDTVQIIKDSIDAVIGPGEYQPGRIRQWAGELELQILDRLAKLTKPFKYVVNAYVAQKVGAAYCCYNSGWWDDSSDGYVNYKWENEDVRVCVTVAGFLV